MRTLIIIPARYGSARFPGKPLALINGVSMVRRTADIARQAADSLENCSYAVATDDERIQDHSQSYSIPVIMTPSGVRTGSDRALAAVNSLSEPIDFVINLQGDAPLTPVQHITAIATALKTGAKVATPYIKLSWEALDIMRSNKVITPFSGTTVAVGPNGKALWFSKTIIPAIRKELDLREASALSPICRHVGLYGYRLTTLERFVGWPESRYELLEGLEQLRLIENGVPIDCVEVQPPTVATSGIDTPEDIKRVEQLIARHGDPFKGER